MSERYDLLEKIGQTKWGERFRGFDRDSDVSVEILQLDPEKYDFCSQKFKSVVKTARALRPEGLVYINDFDAKRGLIVFSEYRGQTLRDRIDKSPISQDDARLFLIRMLRLVQAFQNVEPIFVHGEICPEQILLANSNDSITDVKLLQSLGPTWDGTLLFTGSYKYYAPEMFEVGSAQVTSSADLYTIAFVTLEALVGKEFDEYFASFSGNEQRRWSIIHGSDQNNLQNLKRFVPKITPDLQNVLECMLAKDPANRPRDVAALIDRLEESSPTSLETSTEIRNEEPLSTPKVKISFGEDEDSYEEEDENVKRAFPVEDLLNRVKTFATRPYCVWSIVSFLIVFVACVVAELPQLQPIVRTPIWAPNAGSLDAIKESNPWILNPTDLQNRIERRVEKEDEDGKVFTDWVPLPHGSQGWQAVPDVVETYVFHSRDGKSEPIEAKLELDPNTNAYRVTLPGNAEYPTLTANALKFTSKSTSGQIQLKFPGESDGSVNLYINGKRRESFPIDAKGNSISIDVPAGTIEIAVERAEKRFKYLYEDIAVGELKSVSFDLAPSGEQDPLWIPRRDEIVKRVMGFDVELWRSYDPDGRKSLLKALEESYEGASILEKLDRLEFDVLTSLHKVVLSLFEDKRLTVEYGEYNGVPINPWDKLSAYLDEYFNDSAPSLFGKDPRPKLWRAVVDAQRATRDFLLKTPKFPPDAAIKQRFEQANDRLESAKQIGDEYVKALLGSNDSEYNTGGVSRIKGFKKVQESLKATFEETRMSKDDQLELILKSARKNKGNALKETQSDENASRDESDSSWNPGWRAEFAADYKILESKIALGGAALLEALMHKSDYLKRDENGSVNIEHEYDDYPISDYEKQRRALIEIAWNALNDMKLESSDKLKGSEACFIFLAAKLRRKECNKETEQLLGKDAAIAEYGANSNRYFAALAEHLVNLENIDDAIVALSRIDSNATDDIKAWSARTQLKIDIKSSGKTDFSKVKESTELLKRLSKANEFTWENVNERFNKFYDNPATFAREFAINLVLLANKAGEAGDENTSKYFRDVFKSVTPYATCPIQCLLFSNPSARCD